MDSCFQPKNLGIMADGRLVLFDFGISKLLKRKGRALVDGVQMTGMCGSLRYMAPEVTVTGSKRRHAAVLLLSCH